MLVPGPRNKSETNVTDPVFARSQKAATPAPAQLPGLGWFRFLGGESRDRS